MSTLLEQASLVMIPSGYKEDVVYSQIPTNGNGDLTFTRASNGTRINSAGLVEVCPWNLLQYSEQFDNAYWSKANTTISANATTAPNGTTTADKIISSAVNDEHIVYYFESTYLNQVVTMSAYVKKSDYRYAILRSYTNGAYRISVFDLDNGVVQSQDLGTSYIESVGNGWFRISATFTTPSSTFGVQYAFGASTTYTYLGDGTSGNFLWGAQLNIGSTAKPYFPTTDRLNVPRLTYQNGGGGCPSLLLEKQSTNLALYSEDFTQSVWSAVFLSASVSANQTTSPDGTQNADLIADTATTAEFGVGQLITATNNIPQTVSIYIKANGSNFAMLRFYGNNVQYYYCVVVNLSTGVITKTQAGSGASSTSSTITNMGNGWYRVTATATMNTVNYYLIVGLVPSATPTIGNFGDSPYTGTGSNSIYVWGAQFE